MALSETAKLVVDLSLKGNFVGQIGKATTGLDKFDQKAGRAYVAGQQIGTGIKRGAAIGAVGVGILVSQVALGLKSLVELEQAEAQTAAVLKSTGQVAGINGAQVTALAEKYEALNAQVGDEFIRAGQNMLLTFTKVRGKAFEPALAAILDMNTALGKGPDGLTKTAIQVGKALNDPTKGLTALSKAGVTFTRAQADKIKSLQEEGKLYEAQQIILKELNKEFGGSFAAQGGTTAGKVSKFTDSIEDLQRALAKTLLPAVGNVADALSELLADPEIIRGVEDLGTEIGKVFSKGNIKEGARILGEAFDNIKGALPGIKGAVSTIGSVVGTAVDAFSKLDPAIQKLAIGAIGVNHLTGGLVTNVAGGLISAVLGQLKSAVVGIQAGVVNVNGPTAPGKTPGSPSTPGGGGGGGTKAPSPNGRTPSPDRTSQTMTRVGGLIAVALAVQGDTTRSQLGSDAQETQRRIDVLNGTLATLEPNDPQIPKLQQQIVQLQTKGAETVDKLNGVKASQDRTALEVQRKGEQTASQVRTSSAQNASTITAAIRANRPITNVAVNVSATTVSKTVIVTNRYGSNGGSRNQDSNGSGTLGNGGS